MNFSSKLLEAAVTAFAQLPGVGTKTALRFVLHLLKMDSAAITQLSTAISHLHEKVVYCKICNNVSDQDICITCSLDTRIQEIICVVENVQSVMAIENTNYYKGVYHVLGGLISPMDGVGPSDLPIESLVKRLERNKVAEVIFALNATMEGDTTTFYLYKKLKHLPIKISTIARGISFGGELEYMDEVTLGRSIASRVAYEPTS